MTRSFSKRTTRCLGLATAASLLVALPVPLAAQDDASNEARLRKIEAEIRALQRKVFPGGNPRFFEAEIAPQSEPKAPPPPSTSALTDILSRLDALESQLQTLTARSEENSFAIRQITARLDALAPGASEGGAGEMGTSEGGASEGSAPMPRLAAAASPPAPVRANPAASSAAAKAPQATATDPAGPSEAQSGPSPERIAAVKAIAKPQTDDPGDDEYSYGFRLWNAGFYPEARQQLSLFLEKYPDHWRATYARNLIGRAYLDEGRAREAAPWFLKNYQTDKQAVRAGDSLLYLAEAMIALGDDRRACIALAEFAETYPALATGRLKDQYEANRKKVRCD